MASPASVDLPTSVEELRLLFKLQAYAKTYADYPKDFIPEGFTNPNYIPPNRGRYVIDVATVTTSIAIVIGCLRLFSRSRLSGRLRPDDWFLIPGMLLTLTVMVIQILSVRLGGMGKHVFDNRFKALEACLKLIYAHIIVYYVNLTVIKTSILLFVYELAPISNRALRLFIRYFIGFLWFWLVVCCFLSSFSCTPAAATFDLRVRIEGSHCLNATAIAFGLNSVLALTDIIIVALPTTIVWKLQLPLSRKIGIILLFSLGLLSCIANVLKLITVNKAYASYDFTWHSVPTLMWAQIEGCLAIIVASLPSLNAIFMRIFKWGKSTVTTRASGYGRDTGMRASQGGIEIKPFSNGSRHSYFKPPTQTFQELGSTPDVESV